MNGVRQHKNMAMGKPIDGAAGNFGVEPIGKVQMHPDRRDGAAFGRTLADPDRGAGMRVGAGESTMGAQRHPDHGEHMSMDNGMSRKPRPHFVKGG